MSLQSVETQDVGKPFTDAMEDLGIAAGVYRFHATLADKIGGRTIPVGRCCYKIEQFSLETVLLRSKQRDIGG